MKKITLLIIMIVVLDNIRSKHNVGSIFRTSDALGVDKIYLCGVTPSPIDKYGRKVGAISKVSLGAEENIAWEKSIDTIPILKKLKEEDHYLIAIEQYHLSVPYHDIELDDDEWKNSVLVLGNEVDGLSEEIIKTCDQVAEIPMVGKKESLNVSVSFGIVAFSLKNSKI